MLDVGRSLTFILTIFFYNQKDELKDIRGAQSEITQLKQKIQRKESQNKLSQTRCRRDTPLRLQQISTRFVNH